MSAFSSILVVGDLMLDVYIQGDVYRTSPEAPVPIVLESNKRFVAGGAANVALNICAMGIVPSLIGVVGRDDEASKILELLQEKNIETDDILVDVSRPTTSKTRVVGNLQQITRIDREKIHEVDFDLERSILDRAKRKLRPCSVLVLSDYRKGVLTDSVISKLIEIGRSAGCFIIVDPKRQDFNIYAGANLIKPNQTELEVAVGRRCYTDAEVVLACQELSARTDSAFLVTRAEKGMCVVERNGESVHLGTTAVEVSDVSGAGDTCLAALSVAIASGVSLVKAVELANIAAGIAVAKFGTSVVTMNEIQNKFSVNKISLSQKICNDYERAKLIVSEWRSAGKSIVFTNGCFDLLHSGHIHLLERAASEGDRLVVGVNSDSSVKSLKGDDRPVNSEAERSILLAALQVVDLIIVFEATTPESLIEILVPDVLVKGGDYDEKSIVGRDFVVKNGGRVCTIPLVEGKSTSNIIGSIKESMFGISGEGV